MTHGRTAPIELTDDPINLADDDLLGRDSFVAQTAALIDNVTLGSSSTVFGLVAPWGAGKTSLLNLVRLRLDDEHWNVVEFNPWELSDIEALIREFIVTLSSALPSGSRGKRARRALRKYGLRAASFAAAARTPVVDIGKLVSAAFDASGKDDSLSALRNALTAELQKLDARVLVLIDDVDRLQVDELLTLLKLVRVVGRLPNVSYLLAYDESTIRDVLSHTEVGSRPGRPQAYMEKIVQVRVDVPPAHPTHRLALSNWYIEAIAARHSIGLTEQEWDRFSHIYQEQLVPMLSGPRQIKRFYMQIEAYLPLVAREVDFIDFVVITALRTFFPGLHAALPTMSRALTNSELRLDTSDTDRERDRWNRFVRQHIDDGSEGTAIRLLASVFRPVHQVAEEWTPGPGELSEIVARQGVGCSEYFERYIYLGVPPDDISDAIIRQALAEMVKGGGPVATRVLDILRASTDHTAEAEPIVAKLKRFAPTDPTSARAFLPFAAAIAQHAPDTGFMAQTSRTARWWLQELLTTAPLHDPADLLDELADAVGLVELRFAFVAEDDNTPPLNATERPAFRQALIARIRSQLQANQSFPVSERPDSARLISAWAALDDDEALRHWLQAAALTPPWTVIDVATFFVSTRKYSGDATWSLGPYDDKKADRLLGLRFALAHCAPTADGQPIDWDGWNGHTPDTFDNRLRWTHAALHAYVENTTAPTEVVSDQAGLNESNNSE